MGDEPFLALKVGPYACYCMYGANLDPDPAGEILPHCDEESPLGDDQSPLLWARRCPHRAHRGRANREAPHSGRGPRRAISLAGEPGHPDVWMDGVGPPNFMSEASASSRASRLEHLKGDLQRGADQMRQGIRKVTHKFMAAISGSPRASSVDETPLRRRQSVHDILPRRRLAQTSNLEWVEALIRRVWPKIDRAIAKVVEDQVEPRLQELSGALSGLYFKEFTLGTRVPKLRSLEIWEAPCKRIHEGERGLEVRLDLALEAGKGHDGVNIQIADRYTSLVAGISSLTVKGELVLRLEPLLDRPPIVGGVVAYFLDPPKVEARFEGLAKIADFAILQSHARSIINREIGKTLVLPNVLHVPLIRDEQIVDSAMLKDPKPFGVLRVTALSARNLTGVDWHLFRKATSDPYLRLMLSADEWKSKPMYGTCNPDWPASEYKDFLVYAWEQKLRIDVHDWGPLKSHDLLGQAKPLTVRELLKRPAGPFPLYGPLADVESEEPSPQCGELSLRFEWLEILPENDHDADGAVVRVKLDELYLPHSLGEEWASVSARIGDVEQTTKEVRGQLPRPKSTSCSFHAEETIFEIEHVINLILPPKSTPDQVLELRVLGRRGKTLGSFKLNLAEVADKPKEWPRHERLIFGPPPRRETKRPSQHSQGTSPASEARISAEVTISWHSLSVVAGKVATQEPVEANSPTSDYSASGSSSSKGDDLHWINQAFSKLWPKVVVFIRQDMEKASGMVNQKLQAKMPWFLKGIKFSRFWLGNQPPVFTLKQVRDAPEKFLQAGMQGVELHLGFHLDSQKSKNSDIELDLGILNLRLGIRSICITGEMVVRLEPLLDEPPVIGGVVITCLNRPRVDMAFSGLAARVVDRGLEGNLRSLIDNAISSCLVMPNVIGMPLGREIQGVDRALLRQPKLLGVLRVKVLYARVWPRDPLTKLIPLGCTSRMLVKMKVADAERYCEEDVTIERERAKSQHERLEADELEMGEAELWGRSYDFLVYDERQYLEVEVVDKCRVETVLAKKCTEISEVIREHHVVLQLFCPNQDGRQAVQPEYDRAIAKRREREGEVGLSCQLLEAKYGSLGSDREWCMLRVKVDEALVPWELLLPDDVEEAHHILGIGASIAARVGEVEKVTPLAKYYLKRQGGANESNDHLQTGASGSSKGGGRICERLTAEQLRERPGDPIELEVEFVLYLPVRKEDLDSEVLQLQLRGRNKDVLGNGVLKLADVKKKSEHKLTDDNFRLVGPKGPDSWTMDSEVMIVVSILGLEPAKR